MSGVDLGLREIARTVIASDGSEPLPLSAQWLASQVRQSCSDPDALAKWTSSTVIDDNVDAPMFDEKIFFWLHRDVAGQQQFPIGHAGLMHTYGYLMSTVATPYGLKRDRWLTTDLADAVGVPPLFFHPNASTTPLMTRVAEVIIPILTDPLAVDRAVLVIDEIIDSDSRMRSVYVQNPKSGSTALVYGRVSHDEVQLTSVFPRQPLTAEDARARIAEPTKFRYNYAPSQGAPGSALDGTVEVLKNSIS